MTLILASKNKLRESLEKLLSRAGITVNGSKTYDITVSDDRFFSRVLGEGSLGLGESYMDGWWECLQLDVFFDKLLRARLDENVHGLADYGDVLKAKIFNLQNPRRAFQIGEHHYDTGNDLFEVMLDKRMIYSCGYWKDAKTLDDAQEAKLDLTCRKLGLKEGMTLLDIGCGWGGMAAFAAEKYGAKVVGVTVSKEQQAMAKERYKGLPVDFRLQDYRDITEKFDRVVSIGMFEHVGHKNYRTFFEVSRRCLADNGLLLLHTIGSNITSASCDPWIGKYIFPNSNTPSVHQIAETSEKYFVMEDWHNFGPDYDKTLMCWYENFENAWDKLKGNYSERFRRMWRYYLLCCAGSFRSRKNQLWQIVFSPEGVRGGYTPVR